MTTADLIAATVLFGPAAIAIPALAYRILAGRRDTAAVAAVLDELRSQHQTHTTEPNTPPDSGEPQPHPAALAPVIPAARHRRTA